MAKLKTSMLTAENWLALKQDWIDLMNAKLNTTHSQFQMAMEEHNKEVNPSGVPFKGRKRTTIIGHAKEISDESNAKRLWSPIREHKATPSSTPRTSC